MKKRILLVLAVTLIFGVLITNTQAAIASQNQNIWELMASRLKEVFFPSQYSAFTQDALTNPFTQLNTGLPDLSVNTSGFNCVNYTCVKVSSNAKYTTETDCKKVCKTPSVSIMTAPSGSVSLTVPPTTKATTNMSTMTAPSGFTNLSAPPTTKSSSLPQVKIDSNTTPMSIQIPSINLTPNISTIPSSDNLNTFNMTNPGLQIQPQVEVPAVQSTTIGGLWTDFLKSMKDIFAIPSTNLAVPQNMTDTSLQDTIFPTGDKQEEGTDCKIISITISPKKSLYEIGDTIKGTVKSSCATGAKVNKYTIEFIPEKGKKGGGISTTSISGTFEVRYDVTLMSMLAKAGQSGKTKLKIMASAIYDSPTGATSTTSSMEIYVTVNAGSTTENGTETGGETIKFKTDPTAEYKDQNGKIKLTIISKPADLTSCGYTLEADYRNKGYEYKNEGVEIKGCSGSIDIPISKANKIKLSLTGSVVKGNDMTIYKSDPTSIELKYNPEAKEAPKTDIDNSCTLEITKMEPNSNRITVTNQQTQDIKVSFKLKCSDYTKIDVKPTKVSAYIDIHQGPTINDKRSVECGSQTLDGKTIYKQGTEYSFTCSAKTLATLPNDASAKYLMVDMYYMTDLETGIEHGTREARFISTQDRAIVTDQKTGDGTGKVTPKEIITLEVDPIIAAEKETLNMKVSSTTNLSDEEEKTTKCMIYWKNSEGKEGSFISDYEYFALIATGKFTAQKDSAGKTYIQVRCADGKTPTKYFSNTVTVSLKTVKKTTETTTEPKTETSKKYGNLSFISNLIVKTILTKIESSKEITILAAGNNTIENKKLETGTYVIYSSVPSGYAKPAGWNNSVDYPGYIWQKFELTEAGKVIKISWSKSSSVSTGETQGFSATCTASPETVEVGKSVTFKVSVSNGKSPYTYEWKDFSGNKYTNNTDTYKITANPELPSPLPFTVTVTDAQKNKTQVLCDAKIVSTGSTIGDRAPGLCDATASVSKYNFDANEPITGTMKLSSKNTDTDKIQRTINVYLIADGIWSKPLLLASTFVYDTNTPNGPFNFSKYIPDDINPFVISHREGLINAIKKTTNKKVNLILKVVVEAFPFDDLTGWSARTICKEEKVFTLTLTDKRIAPTTTAIKVHFQTNVQGTNIELLNTSNNSVVNSCIASGIDAAPGMPSRWACDLYAEAGTYKLKGSAANMADTSKNITISKNSNLFFIELSSKSTTSSSSAGTSIKTGFNFVCTNCSSRNASLILMRGSDNGFSGYAYTDIDQKKYIGKLGSGNIGIPAGRYIIRVVLNEEDFFEVAYNKFADIYQSQNDDGRYYLQLYFTVSKNMITQLGTGSVRTRSQP